MKIRQTGLIVYTTDETAKTNALQHSSEPGMPRGWLLWETCVIRYKDHACV